VLVAIKDAPRKRCGLKAILDRRCAQRSVIMQAETEKRRSNSSETVPLYDRTEG
jgi:hypothetical protein